MLDSWSMKKLLAFVVLGLMWSGNAFAAKFVGKACSKTFWTEPCYCSEESSYAKKKYCNFKMGYKPEKYMSYCAEKAGEYKPEFRNKMYKSCMKERGF